MKRYCFFVLFMACVLVAQAESWKPKPWQVYLIEQKVKADTIPSTQSIMLSHRWHNSQLHAPHFDIPYYEVPKQKTMFEQWDEQERNARILRGEYNTSEFVVDMLSDVIGIFLK